MYTAMLLISTFVLSFVLAGAIRKYALAKSLIDVPNERSSHKVPTPRGGGLGMVAAYMVFGVAINLILDISTTGLLVALVPAFAAALIGFWDDHGHVEALYRLILHFCCAFALLFLLPSLPLIFPTIEWLQIALYLPATLYLVWMLNLYNFMDGIDGIAGMEAFTVCLGGGLLWWWANESPLAFFPFAVAAAALGFLLWNFPKAKIFMGDGGSGFLGFILGSFALIAGGEEASLFWAWNILLGVFIVDSTLTLIRRILDKQQFSKAHRTHAYQYASRRHNSHAAVTTVVAIINVVWLLPIAWMVVAGHIHGLVGVIIAYPPLLILAVKYHAGVREEVVEMQQARKEHA